MQECSLKNVCGSNRYPGCHACSIARALAEAEKPADTYVEANLTDEQLDKLIDGGGTNIKKSYCLFPDNAFIYFWIAVTVITAFAIYKGGH